MTPPQVQRIASDQLADTLEDVRKRGAEELVLVKRGAWAESNPEYAGRVAYQLSAPLNEHSRLLTALPAVRRLHLVGLNIDDDRAKLIARNFPDLTSLDLSSNQIGLAGTSAIAQNLRHLTSLDLSSNPVSLQGITAITRSLPQLTSLNLVGCKIGSEGAKAIAQGLPELSSLNLVYNRIGDEGAKAIALGLPRLTSLKLGSNEISHEGTETIAERLGLLTALDLSFNDVGDEGAKAMGKSLHRLTSLIIFGTTIGFAGCNALAQNLRSLTSLNLGGNVLGDAAATVIAQHLRELKSLHLWGNGIGAAGAKALAENLGQLTELGLGENRVGDDSAKAIAHNLARLTLLDLRSSELTREGAKAIAQNLTRLTRLFLKSDKIGRDGVLVLANNLRLLTALSLVDMDIGDDTVTEVATALPELKYLDLRENRRLTSVKTLSACAQLTKLDLAFTGVTDLRPLKRLIEAGLDVESERYSVAEAINVHDCPLVHPTPEVVRQGREAVLNYFRELERQGEDQLYEAKVLVIGEGRAGKTSLVRRLYHPEQDLPTEDESTRGIHVEAQTFVGANGKPFRLNVWDFGGQQIYHATHQFFLTKNSLYVLVDDTCKDHKSVRDEGFKYWLEVVEAFAGRSPVLIFQNEKGGRSKRIDEAGIKGRFPNVLEVHAADLANRGAAAELRRAVEHHAQGLAHVGEAVPAKWVTVRDAIEVLAKTRPYISRDEYFALYAEHLEADREKALFLSRYLHDLGVFLHFQDDRQLERTVIIQNRWATEAVFRILDDEPIKQRSGRFTPSDCARLWSSTEYASMHLELLALMERFELCYKFRDSAPETWLVPQLLSPSAPNEAATWASADDLVLSYRYEFLPRGLVSRLMVRLHRFVRQPERCWAAGALFERDDNALLARAEDSGDAITLRARGPEKKALLSVVASELDALNESFPGLRARVNKWVPCQCATCSAAIHPELFEEKQLLHRKRNHRLQVECPKSFEMVSVLSLLDGLRFEPHLREDDEIHLTSAFRDAHARSVIKNFQFAASAATQKVRVFLASAEELRADRDAFELYFRQRNDEFLDRGLYLEIVRWENFLDAMSETRLQDEYNKEVRSADVFVALFWTKTGKFTEEEFDAAHAAFKQNKRPRIFTFFRSEPQFSADQAGLAAMTTLVQFKEKLEKLGHFYTSYSDAEHLKRLFSDQLRKLEKTGW